jgi:hypothetical protein
VSEKKLSTLLDDSLDWISETGESIQAAASRHPEHFEELMELLQTYEVLGSYERPVPRPEFKAAARTRLMNQISVLDKTNSTKPLAKTQPIRLIWQKILEKRRLAMTWLMRNWNDR